VPLAPQDGSGSGHAPCLRRTHNIAHRLFEVQVALAVIVLLDRRPCGAYDTTVAWTRSQVVAFHLRGLQVLVAQNLGADCSRTNADASTAFDDPSTCTRLVDLGIPHGRGQHPTRWLAGSTGPTSWRWRCRSTVVGDQCFARRRPLVPGQHGWSASRTGLQGRQECGRRLRAALRGERRDHTHMTGPRARPPEPGLIAMAGIVRGQVCRFVVTKVPRASICAGVNGTPRMPCVLTAAACWPAQANPWRTVLG
jgi:hypothetical protein